MGKIMPSPLIHIGASIAAGYCIGLHDNNKYKVIVSLAFLHEFVDLDHFFDGVVFHTMFIFIMLPLFILIVTSIFDIGFSKNTTWTRYALVFFVIMVGHMLLDSANGKPMMLFYPFSTTWYVVSSSVVINHAEVYVYSTTPQTPLIIWGLIILGANLLETFIFYTVDVGVRARNYIAFTWEKTLNKYSMKAMPIG